MIDFKSELSKYKPIMEVDEVETSINNNDVRDLLDILKSSLKKSSE